MENHVSYGADAGVDVAIHMNVMAMNGSRAVIIMCECAQGKLGWKINATQIHELPPAFTSCDILFN